MILRLLIFFLLPVCVKAQHTSAPVCDSINAGLVALSYDTLVQTYDVFRDSGGDLYTYLQQVSGKQFLCLKSDGTPEVFRFNQSGLKKAWHEYEIDNWISGATGANYSGYSFSGTVTITCTITISGDDFTGEASNNTDAFGLAFYHFLIDPDFATYLE